MLSESFRGAAEGTAAPRRSPAGPGEPGEAELPAGTVTFLLTDIEGSTRLWETVPEAMEVALERHNETLLAEVIGHHGGVVVTSRGEGDSFFAVFPARFPRWRRPVDASCGPDGGGVAGRVPGCGCGWGCTPVRRAAATASMLDHAPINRCARVKAAAHGGQVLLTKTRRATWCGRSSWTAGSG